MSLPIKFLVFAGKKQVGKTTCADFVWGYLVENNYCVVKASFATALKNTCRDLLGVPWSPNDTEEDKNKLTDVMWQGFPRLVRNKYGCSQGEYRCGPMTRREVWQVFGTDIMRDMVKKDVWIQALFKQDFEQQIKLQQLIDIPNPSGIVIIIDDGRYLDELEYTKRYDTTIVHVVRDKKHTSTHKSEIALDGVSPDFFDDVIQNNGTKRDLQLKVESLIDDKILT